MFWKKFQTYSPKWWLNNCDLPWQVPVKSHLKQIQVPGDSKWPFCKFKWPFQGLLVTFIWVIKDITSGHLEEPGAQQLEIWKSSLQVYYGLYLYLEPNWPFFVWDLLFLVKNNLKQIYSHLFKNMCLFVSRFRFIFVGFFVRCFITLWHLHSLDSIQVVYPATVEARNHPTWETWRQTSGDWCVHIPALKPLKNCLDPPKKN